MYTGRIYRYFSHLHILTKDIGAKFCLQNCNLL